MGNSETSQMMRILESLRVRYPRGIYTLEE